MRNTITAEQEALEANRMKNLPKKNTQNIQNPQKE